MFNAATDFSGEVEALNKSNFNFFILNLLLLYYYSSILFR